MIGRGRKSQGPDKRLDPWLAKMRKRRKQISQGFCLHWPQEWLFWGSNPWKIGNSCFPGENYILDFLIINKIILNWPKERGMWCVADYWYPFTITQLGKGIKRKQFALTVPYICCFWHICSSLLIALVKKMNNWFELWWLILVFNLILKEDSRIYK